MTHLISNQYQQLDYLIKQSNSNSNMYPNYKMWQSKWNKAARRRDPITAITMAQRRSTTKLKRKEQAHLTHIFTMIPHLALKVIHKYLILESKKRKTNRSYQGEILDNQEEVQCLKVAQIVQKERDHHLAVLEAHRINPWFKSLGSILCSRNQKVTSSNSTPNLIRTPCKE